MAWNDIDLGAVSAYAVAVENGYKGTAEEWARDQADAAQNAQDARKAAEGAKASEVAAKNALDALLPKQESAIGAIGAEAAKQVGNVNVAGAVQVQAVRDTGKEQADGLAALGAIERGKVAAAGDEQVARVAQTGNAAVESAIEAIQAERGNAVALVQNEGAAQAESVRQAGDQVQASIPKDYTAITATVDALQKGKAPAIECDATGSIVTITDGAAMPVVELISHIEPVQAGSGDPSPENVRPISGWNDVVATGTGKNMLKYPYPNSSKTLNGITFTSNDDGTVTLNGTSTAYAAFKLYEGDAAFDGCIVTGCPADGGSRRYSIRPTTVSGSTTYRDYGQGVTLPEPITELLIVVPEGGIVIDNVTFYPMVRSTAVQDATYEPYYGKTLTANLPETVYGGTLDWTTGVLTVDWKYVDLGTLVWNAVFSVGEGLFWTPDLIESYDFPKANMICSAYKTSQAKRVEEMDNLCIWSQMNAIHRNNVVIKNTAYTDSASFKASLSGVMLAYKVSTPVKTIQLTPQQLDMLKGTNNVWSDCGDTSVVYVADTQMYIDNLFGSLSAAIINN